MTRVRTVKKGTAGFRERFRTEDFPDRVAVQCVWINFCTAAMPILREVDTPTLHVGTNTLPMEQKCVAVRGVSVVESWYGRVQEGRKRMRNSASIAKKQKQSAAPGITEHIAEDVLGLYRNGRTDYRRVADLVKLSKEDLSKIARVAKPSVRFDDAIPAAVAERLREIANIANLVAEYFDGDAQKVALWFELRNPQLGNISPRNMIRGDRYKRLLNFVLEAREAEAAARRRRT